MVDLDALLNGAVVQVFGETLDYKSKALGTSTTIQAPFNEPYRHQVLLEDGTAEWTEVSPFFGCRLSDLQSPPARGDIVTRASGSKYLVYDALPDGMGWVRVLVKVISS